MSKIDKNTQILFFKTKPELEKDRYLMTNHYALIHNNDENNNYYARREEYHLFINILEAFGLNSIVYYGKTDEPMLLECDHEIRITPYIRFKKFDFTTTGITEKEVNRIRFQLYRDAWYGQGHIFTRQVNPENPIGINLTERLNALTDDSLPLGIEYIRYRSEILPKNGVLVDLTDYVEHPVFAPLPEDKISDYQIRVLYNDPFAHFADLISAFRFINEGLGSYFDFIVEE